ncbi:chromate transporter [Pseudoruegeria sp. SK021]|nr:chromate transporter [Pseudoruegeria sp. SK021]
MIPLRELVRVFLRIGLLSFGGPAAQIAVMHRELVEERRWLTEDQYLGALSFCMLLPGPEAMQLVTYAGWRLRGTLGGLIGGLLFVLPGAAVMALVSLCYAWYGAVPLAAAMFLGIKATVVIIVLQALLKVSQRALKSTDRWVIAGLSFVGIFALNLPFPLIILAAGAYGYWRAPAATLPPPDLASPRTLRTVAIWGGLWLAPVALLWASGATFLTELALFFSKLAVVTFGGAYSVLAYMTQRVVTDLGWISTAQMMDGLGLAETTPGPLILVTQFVAMLSGVQQGGTGLALLAGAIALWVTFVPCFLWIFAGAPYVEWIATRPRLSGALSAITAAVVGVILNLSIWFALHVFFGTVETTTLGPIQIALPHLTSFDPVAAGLAVLAGFALLRQRWSLPVVLALAALAGALVELLG